MDRKMLVWAGVGVVGAIGVVLLLSSPTQVETPYDTAYLAAKRFGEEADGHLRELDAMLKANAATGKDSAACAKARVALRQQRVAFRAAQTLTGRTTNSVATFQDRDELRALRVNNLRRTSQTRTQICDGETDPA